MGGVPHSAREAGGGDEDGGRDGIVGGGLARVPFSDVAQRGEVGNDLDLCREFGLGGRGGDGDDA